MLGKKDETALFNFPVSLPVGKWKQSSSNDGIRFFCIKIDEIESPNTQTLRGYKYQCQLILYNVSHQHFVGNMWRGNIVNGGVNKISLNEVIYFYTSMSVKDLLLCAIVIRIEDNLEEILGWTALTLLEVKEKGQNSIPSRVSLLSGSPLALLLMTGNLLDTLYPSENTSSLFELKFSVSAHPLLMRLIHLVPENFLVDTCAPVPGILQTKKSASSDLFKKPQLQKCHILVLSNVVIKVSPSLDAFESDLLKKMAEEKEISDLSEADGDLTIAQRHLQVGVHNGLCYIQESDSYRLLVEPIITTQNADRKHSSSSSTSSYTRENSLVVRSDVKIPNVPDDSNVLVVFVVEYTVSFNNQSANVMSGSSFGRNQSSYVTLLWGACPLSMIRQNRAQSIQLFNDPSDCPNKTLFLKTSTCGNFSLSCDVSTGTKKGSELSKYDNLSATRATSISTGNLLVSSGMDGFEHQRSLSPSQRSISHNILHQSDSKMMSNHQNYLHHKDQSESDVMDEVDVLPSSVPLVPPMVQAHPGAHRLTRSLYAKLYSNSFPVIYDQRGQTVAPIDPSLPYTIDLKREKSTVPIGHKFVFLFLGMSGKSSSVPEAMFFTFKFYRFPSIKTESISLMTAESNATVLHVFRPTKSSSNELSGYQITYLVDPSHLNCNEDDTLRANLAKGNMIVDLWNAESHLYFGTIVVPLKYLCRQGKESVGVTLELDIINTEFLDDSPGPQIPLIHERKGTIHLCLASIKSSLSPKSLKKLKDISSVDTSALKNNMKGQTNAFSPEITIRKASPIVETNREIAKLLAARNAVSMTQDSPVLTEERRRKLARMEAVRSQMGIRAEPVTSSKHMQNFFKERQHDLLVIESYIEKHKINMIHSFLHSSVTSVKHLNAVQGQCYFFEFELTNPFEADHNVYIQWNCSDLSVITSDEEWNYYRKSSNSLKGLKNLISDSNGDAPCLFIRAKECVKIPFKYCYSTSDTSNSISSVKASSGHCFSSDILTVASDAAQCDIKVLFQTGEKTLISALVLKVQQLPPLDICQSLKFLAPEHSIFEKNCVIKNMKHVSKLICSDAEFTYECIPQEYQHRSSPINFVLKGSIGAVGKERTFYLFIYEGKYMSRPTQTWKVSVHAVNRIDLSCVAGQIAQTSVILRGENCSSLVQCFSDSQQLALHPHDAFILAPFAVQELSLSLRCLLPGVGYFRVSMVAQNIEEILCSWLVVVSSQKPRITKAFQVHLTLGKDCDKRVPFNNSHTDLRQFHTVCSHNHLLQTRERTFNVEGKQSYSLRLYFPPQSDVFTETVFLYIYDDDVKNVDSYCIKVNCS